MSDHMPARKKRGKFVATDTREAIRLQVDLRMRARYGSSPNQVKSLADEAGTSKSTIQRILDPERYGGGGITIDVLTQVAQALRCEPWELLQPLRQPRSRRPA